MFVEFHLYRANDQTCGLVKNVRNTCYFVCIFCFAAKPMAINESDTPRGAGGLMSWTASKAVGHGFKASR